MRNFCLAMILAALAGCSRNGKQVRLVWLHSGAPASGLDVTVTKSADGVFVQKVKSDSSGAVPADAAADWLTVRDSSRGLVLVEKVPVSPNSRELRVPEPVRIHGTLSGAGKVRAGFGERMLATERRRAEARDPFLRSGDMNRPLGIELPASPSRWVDSPVNGTTFETGWIAADRPQLVAFDAEGRIAVADVAVPANVAAGASIDAGPVTLTGPSALNIQLDVPATDLPLGFLLTIQSVTVDPAMRAEVARIISVLDQVDPRLFDLLTLRTFYPLQPGANRLAPFPLFRDAKVVVLDSAAGVRAERTIAFGPSGQAGTQLTAAELSPRYTKPPTTVSGQLVLAGTNRPVRRAKVVYSDFPERQETITNDDGAFVFHDVHSDRPATVFVDSRASAAPAGYSTTQIFRGVDARAHLRLELAATSAQTASINPLGDGRDCTTDEQYPSFAGYLLNQGQEKFVPINSVNIDYQSLRATISVPVAGAWHFRLAQNAFELALGGGQFDVPNQPYVVQLTVPQQSINVTLQLITPTGFISSGTSVYFPSFTEDPDPLELDTDRNGLINLRCVNTSPIYVFVNIGDGYYDGNVNITGLFKQVRLCPHTQGTCTE